MIEVSLTTLMVLVCVHFLCDYPLQGDFIGKGKGCFAEPLAGVPWWHLMTAHAAIHALGVGIVTNSVVLGAAEFGLHFWIDYAKCRKWTNIHIDQALHVVCKVAWMLLAVNGVA